MRSFSIAVRLWCMTIVFTACGFAGTILFDDLSEALFVWLVLLIGGPIMTLPLLLLIMPMINWSTSLPYNNQGRMAWVAFNLMILFSGVSIVFANFVGGQFFYRLIGTTIAGIVLAVIFTRHSLNKLYNQDHEIRRFFDPGQN